MTVREWIIAISSNFFVYLALAGIAIYLLYIRFKELDAHNASSRMRKSQRE